MAQSDPVSSQHLISVGAEEAHLPWKWVGWNRIGLVFVGQVAGLGQAGENVVSRQAGIVCQQLAFGLTGSEEFENELNGQACLADHWFAGQDLGIDHDAFRKRHNHSLACKRTDQGVPETFAAGFI